MVLVSAPVGPRPVYDSDVVYIIFITIGFMCCPCPNCGNTRSYSDRKILHTHLLYKGFMPHYNVWTRHGEIGVMMEDSEEEEYDENYVPPEYGDAAMGAAGEDQEEPDDVPNDAAMG